MMVDSFSAAQWHKPYRQPTYELLTTVITGYFDQMKPIQNGYYFADISD